MVHHYFLQALEGDWSNYNTTALGNKIHCTHFKVQDVCKDVRSTAGHFLIGLDDIGEYHRLSAKVVPQQLCTFNAQLTESTWKWECDYTLC